MGNNHHFDVDLAGKHYKFDLAVTLNKKKADVTLGGKYYSIQPANPQDRETIQLFLEQHAPQSAKGEDLARFFKRITVGQEDLPQAVAKAHGVGASELVGVKEDPPQKADVLIGLTRSWPIPGTSPVVSIKDRMAELNIPGARIAVINHGELEWTAGFGELEKPTQIQAASISKTITALTIMCMIDEKVKTPAGITLSLDTNVRDILDKKLWESISNGREDPITIRQLLSHTAGLERDTPTGYRGYDNDPASEVAKTDEEIAKLEHELKQLTPDKQEQIVSTLKQIDRLKLAREKAVKGKLPNLDDILMGKGTNSPPVQVTSPPGTQYAYSGGGAMILQKVIETMIPNRKYEATVKEIIFDPLGIKSTFSPDESSIAHGHEEDGQLIPGGWARQPELAAAGLWSTPEDLAQVAMGIQKSLTHQKGGIISTRLAQEMVTPPEHVMLKKNEEIPGLGVFIEPNRDTTYFYHDGSNLGFRCIMIANDQGQGAVIMTNSERGNELIPEIIRKIADIYHWKGKPSFSMFPPLHPEISQAHLKVDVQQWAKNYKGTYENDDRKGMIVGVEVDKQGKIYFKSPDPDEPLIEITPVSDHVGMINEHGRWFPIEFTKKEDGTLVLTIHGAAHTKKV